MKVTKSPPGVCCALRVKPKKIADQAIFCPANSDRTKGSRMPINRGFCVTDSAKIHKRNRLPLFAAAAAFAALILSACTFALEPINGIDSIFDPANTNTGILRIVNDAKNDALLYGVQVILSDKSLNEYYFENGLHPGKFQEYRLPAQTTYDIKFNNGKGWTKNPQTAHFLKGETVVITFTGIEEVSIDLSGIKGKLTVYNSIPATNGEYLIENIRISSVDSTTGKENVAFYFNIPNGIGSGGKPDFDVLPGDYWVRAQIKNPKTGTLSKWSIPAHVGTYSTTGKNQLNVSGAPGKVTINDDQGGIAVFDERVLIDGQAGGDVNTGYPPEKNPDGKSEFLSIPENNSLGEKGEEISNLGGKVDPDSKPVKAIRVEKLGFPTADKDGITGSPAYTYVQKDMALQEGKSVKTTIYDQHVTAGNEWKLGLAEPGWYMLSFSTDAKAFSKAYPIRLEDRNNDGDVNDPGEMEPGVIPPFNDGYSTWTEKQGVVVNNDTPSEGGQVIRADGSSGAVLSPADAQKPITDIKVYNLNGSLFGHYRNRYGLPIYNGKEWIISPALPPGDYLITLSEGNGAAWTDPPFPLHVDERKNGSISYDKTRPFWKRMTTGKPAPELTSPTDPIWTGNNVNWKPQTEINPKDPIYVVVPSEPQLDKVPPSAKFKELEKLTLQRKVMESSPNSQLDIVHLKTSDLGKINFIKLNYFANPDKAYRIIDLRRLIYTDDNDQSTQGGILPGRRLSLVGFDFKPDLYYVYLSENGYVWWKYRIAVNINASWTTNPAGEVVPISAEDIDQVIYKGEKDNWECPSTTSSPAGDSGAGVGGAAVGNSNGNDGGGLNIPKKGFLVIQNHLSVNTALLSIKRPYKDGVYLVDDGVTYNERPMVIGPNKFEILHLPITGDKPYQVKVTSGTSPAAFYKADVEEGKFTYIVLEQSESGGKGSLDNPVVSSTGDSGILPGASKPAATPEIAPPAPSDDITVVADAGNSTGLMQPGNDPVGKVPDYTEIGGDLFDRNYPNRGDRVYPSGQVQPYLPMPPVSVPFPQGGDGTKQNMNGRGYFNFRFSWPQESTWGVGYLAIQKLVRRGTSTAKDPTGPVIILLDAKASTDVEMQSGEAQRRLGNIYDSSGQGSISGEDRSFNDWQKNWLGLVDPATGWQQNVRPDGTLDPTQPVYRSGKAQYPTNRNAPWSSDKGDTKPNRENGAHRAFNNPGRLYTTGVTTAGLYAPMGTGFEAGEYRVYLYRGADNLYTTSTSAEHTGSGRQKKMYRFYDATFDITIYPGVITTAIYRNNYEKLEGAFAYTPIPQAAYGKLIVLNNPTNGDYLINAMLLDKPGYQRDVNSTAEHEIHRFITALSSSPSSMPSSVPNLLNGNNWGKMNPLSKGQMHTFILPPGGYRIAVQSTRDRDNYRAWYGEDANNWLPVVVTEGETIYLTYTGEELSR
jgi:hypothetical protein